MSIESFNTFMGKIAARIGDKPLDAALEAFLNVEYPAESAEFKELTTLCAKGEAEGWLMQREAGDIKFGRAIKPDTSAHHFSVDVVRMKDVKGPHHTHTTGEIGAIMPIEGAAEFDGKGVGWYVYPPGSSHHPTIRGGEAYVLYLLPDGAIEFTKT